MGGVDVDLMNKQPAITRILPPPTPSLPVEIWEGSRHNLGARLRVGVEKGRIATAGPMRPVRSIPGWYEIEVTRLKADPPAWRRAALTIGAVGAVLAGLLLAGWFVVSAVMAYALMITGVLAAAVGGVMLVRMGVGGGNITVVQNVSIRR